MDLSFFMLRDDGRFAVKIMTRGGEIMYRTAWHDQPHKATAEAKAWLQRREIAAERREACGQ